MAETIDNLLYPHLSDEGCAQFEELIRAAKTQITKAAQEAIGDLYGDMGMWIESDAWSNVRNSILTGLTDYRQGRDGDNRRIRRAIYQEYHDEIIRDLDQDMVAEIAALKTALEREREYVRRY